jgi:hypothetical protein
MQCNNNDDLSNADFFGLNSYSWCGGSASFESAGYNTIVDMFKASSVPVFFSEYGCNEVMPRVFDEVAALYSDKMKSLSGGLVYEYSQEEANYGLATINANGTLTLRADYDNLQKQFNKLDMEKIQAADPSQTGAKAPKCDAKLITNSAFDSNFTIPAVCPDCDNLIKNGIDKPTKGKIVECKDTKSPNVVYGSKGGEVKDLQLVMMKDDSSNVPDGQVSPKQPSAPTPFQNSTSSSTPTNSTTSPPSSSNSNSNSTSPAAPAASKNCTCKNSPPQQNAAPPSLKDSSTYPQVNLTKPQVTSPEGPVGTGSGVPSTNIPTAPAASSPTPSAPQSMGGAASMMASTSALVAGLGLAVLTVL